MTPLMFIIVFCVYVIALSVLCAWLKAKVKPWVYSLGWAAWCTFWFVWNLLTQNQYGVAVNALVGSYWWHDFWRKKPPFDRKKTAKLIGAKARALKEKLVAAMPKASPVGQPVLVPAGV